MKNWLNQDLAIGDYVINNTYQGNSMYVGEITHMRTGRDGIDKMRMIDKFRVSNGKTHKVMGWDRDTQTRIEPIEPGGWNHAYRVIKIDKSTFDNIVVT